MEYNHITPLRELLLKCNSLYIVGGTVRDYLLGKSVHDIDVVIDRDPAEVLSGKFFPLDRERGIYRLIHKDLTLDVSKIQGRDITEDLRRRDFTVNAIAYDPVNNRFIDPLGGLEDLRKGVLRMVSEKNLQEDPLRILRGIRLWLYLPLRLEKGTIHSMAKNAHLIEVSAPERVKEELVLILSHRVSSKGILLMKRTGVLDVLFPEIKACRGLFQGKFYGVDLREHLVYCYICAERIVNHLNYFFPYSEVKEAICEETEKGVSKGTLLKLSALLHDIGKPETFRIQKGDYTFWGHDKVGGEKTLDLMERMRFSSKSARTASNLVANHMRLHLLARTGEITPKAKGRFFRQLKSNGVLTVLLSLADSLASSGDLGFYYLLPYAKEMIEFYREFLKEQNLQKPLLSGYEVMDILHIQPSPLVGEVLNKLLEAQTEGIIKTKEEAIKFVKEVFQDGRGNPIH